jgi:putative ATPase
MRGSDPDAAVYWLHRMLAAGEDPRFLCRRMVIHASEDVGMADPMALVVATAAAHALEFVGLPEAQIPMTQAAIYIATAPKSNAVIKAIGRAKEDLRTRPQGPAPIHLRDAHYKGAKHLGHGKGYQYPHDFPGGYVEQTYVPDGAVSQSYYEPTSHGHEAEIRERMASLRRDEEAPARD